MPVVVLSGFINFQYLNSGMEQVRQARTRLLENNMEQIDREMDLAASYMNSLVYYSSSTVYLTDRSRPQFYYAAGSLHSEIEKTALYYQYASGFFVHVPSTEFDYIYVRDSSLVPLQETLRDSLNRDAGGEEGWTCENMAQERYLVRRFSSGGIEGGAFLNLDRLPLPGGENSGYCTAEELEQIRDELPRGSVLLSVPSTRSQAAAYDVLDRREAAASLPFVQRYLLVITAVMACCVPLLYLILRRMVVEPLHRLTDAMARVEAGDLETKIDEDREHSREFRQIDAAFNHMTGEIRSLKIAVYEEQLETEKTKLQNLSYQLRPHFMINCLNMAYNMVTCGENTSALRLMRFAACYMRYLLRSQDDFAPLREELKHLEDYMGIQAMRYEGLFRYETEVDPFVEDISIPSMILQNFVENSVKYSIGPDRFTVIRLTVKYCEEDGEPGVCITVRDDGAGYPDWLLEALQKEDMEGLRDRVGLRNTLQRLRILYGGRARCQFFCDGGAVTRFWFPLDMTEGEEEEESRDVDGGGDAL